MPIVQDANSTSFYITYNIFIKRAMIVPVGEQWWWNMLLLRAMWLVQIYWALRYKAQAKEDENTRQDWVHLQAACAWQITVSRPAGSLQQASQSSSKCIPVPPPLPSEQCIFTIDCQFCWEKVCLLLLAANRDSAFGCGHRKSQINNVFVPILNLCKHYWTKRVEVRWDLLTVSPKAKTS